MKERTQGESLAAQQSSLTLGEHAVVIARMLEQGVGIGKQCVERAPDGAVDALERRVVKLVARIQTHGVIIVFGHIIILCHHIDCTRTEMSGVDVVHVLVDAVEGSTITAV